MNTKNQSTADINASQTGGKFARNTRPNPIFGYNIVSVTATQPGTTIYRLKKDVFNEFLRFDRIRLWYEKEVESKLPKQVRFETASKKIRQAVLNSIKMRIYEPNIVLLRAGDLPKNLLFLVQGRIQVLSKSADAEKSHPNAFILQTEVGPRNE